MTIAVCALWAIGFAAAMVVRPSHALRANTLMQAVINIGHTKIRVSQVTVIALRTLWQGHLVIAWAAAIMNRRHAQAGQAGIANEILRAIRQAEIVIRRIASRAVRDAKVAAAATRRTATRWTAR